MDAEQILWNLAATIRRETRNGRPYIVARGTSIVPGVLSGSKGPLLYEEPDIRLSVNDWNDRPIVVYHPIQNGIPVSGRHPTILDRSKIGRIYDTVYNGKLEHDFWFSVEDTKRVDDTLPPASRILPRLEAGIPIEVSTGLYTENEPAQNGANHKGTPYSYKARNFRPDHMAILPDQVGACSNKDGCGVLVNTMLQVKSLNTGRFKPLGSGTGKGEFYDAAQAGAMVLTELDHELGQEAAEYHAASGDNPASWVMDEAKWKRAKEIATEGGYTGNVYWAVVAHIYQGMKGKVGDRKKAPTKNTAEPIDATTLNPDWITRNTGPKPSALAAAVKGLKGAMPGYGQIFVRGSDVWYVGGDGDETEFVKAVQASLAKVRGVGKVTYESEGFPPKDSGWEKITTNEGGTPPDTSTTGDTGMSFDKAKTIGFITANCDCWKGKEAVLNGLDEPVLVDLELGVKRIGEKLALANNVLKEIGAPDTLTVNEMPAFIKSKMGTAKEGAASTKCPKCKTGTMSGGKCAECGYTEGKEPTKNEQTPPPEKKPMTLNEMLASASPEERETWETAVRITANEKNNLIERLVANAPTDAAKKAAREVYAPMKISQLEALASALPPVTNESREDRKPAPRYLSAGAPDVTTNREELQDAEALEPSIALNFAEMSAYGRKTA